MVRPEPKELPAFLRGTQPDLIALSPRDNVVIEVKSTLDLQTSSDMTDLAQRVANSRGWRFELVTFRQPRPASSERDRWEGHAVAQRLGEARELLARGHVEAAYLLAYAATEAALFSWARSWGGFSSNLPTPLAIAKRMVVSGALARRDLRRFENLVSLRNSVAHGLQTPRATKADVESLLKFGLGVLRAEHG